jgi:hypothetical protein
MTMLRQTVGSRSFWRADVSHSHVSMSHTTSGSLMMRLGLSQWYRLFVGQSSRWSLRRRRSNCCCGCGCGCCCGLGRRMGGASCRRRRTGPDETAPALAAAAVAEPEDSAATRAVPANKRRAAAPLKRLSIVVAGGDGADLAAANGDEDGDRRSLGSLARENPAEKSFVIGGSGQADCPLCWWWTGRNRDDNKNAKIPSPCFSPSVEKGARDANADAAGWLG